MRNTKYIELNENKNMLYQNLWDSVKAVLKDTFVALCIH